MKSNEELKIALIMPYFGKIPKYFDLFEFSLRFNPALDVFLITDQKIKSNLSNLHVYELSFEDFKLKIQSKFDFHITLDKPYKICDYRPAFGYIFEEELKEYDYWGHCDFDLILGDVLSFLPQNMDGQYDKIYQHGHLTLYRNSRENNIRFMSAGGQDYKNVFSTNIACVFDEISGIQVIYDKLNIPAYKQRDCADITPWKSRFRRSVMCLDQDTKKKFNYKYQVFFWQNGKIFRAYYLNKKICYDEFNYLHFQKRDLTFDFEINNYLESFFITNRGFIKRDKGFNVTLKEIKKYNGYNFFAELKIRFKHFIFVWKRRINKYVFKK